MIPIVVYTHSEYSFLWKAAIPLLERYAKGFQIYWCCDSLAGYTLPPSWKLHTYDTGLSWSYRVKGCLDTIESEYIIYIQEDWLLIDTIEEEKVAHCIDFMKEVNCEFLMSYINRRMNEAYHAKYENYTFVKVVSHYFQPAIWKKSLLLELCSLNLHINENECGKCFTISSERNCFSVINTKYSKDISTRTLFFPHMHAIYQGKWCFEKYPCLKALVESFGIDTTKRDIDTTWITHIQ